VLAIDKPLCKGEIILGEEQGNSFASGGEGFELFGRHEDGS
jgi:hypothetical protein